jgi:N-acetylmuramoyl-L-alanine amidase
MSPTIVERPSPNHDARPEGSIVSLLVLHYTDMASAEAALKRLCDPLAEVSAHYLIAEDGTIHRLVPEHRRAWHAGRSRWRGVEGLNATSIGVELANPGHSNGYVPFPSAQMAALVALTKGLIARHPIPQRNVLGHSDIAPERKFDPGELFDWHALAEAGVGLWPEAAGAARTDDSIPLVMGDHGPRVHRLRRRLARYGYGLGDDDRFGPHTAAVVTAFQRHFRPTSLDGRWDGACEARLARLLSLAGEPDDD